jgi:hypothetical protein
MGLLFQQGEFKASVVAPERIQFTEQELSKLIADQRMYFGLGATDCTILITSAHAYALQEQFNILATKTAHQSGILDTAIYGPALLVNCDELAPSVKVRMRLQSIRSHE